MAFFTRKGMTVVPDLPSDCVLTEEPEEFNLPSTPSSPSASLPDEKSTNKSMADVNSEYDAITKESAQQQPNEEATIEGATVEKATVEEATVEEATIEEATVEEATVEEATVEDATVEEATRTDMNPSVSDVSSPSNECETNEDQARFEYVVDRTYGVEV